MPSFRLHWSDLVSSISARGRSLRPGSKGPRIADFWLVGGHPPGRCRSYGRNCPARTAQRLWGRPVAGRIVVPRAEHGGDMKAAVVREFGKPLVIEDRPVPVPGPGQITIRMECPSDEQPRLDVIRSERLSKQGIGHQVDLAGCQVVGGTPVPVNGLGVCFGQFGNALRRSSGLPIDHCVHRGQPGQSPRTTTTGQCAPLTQWTLTEPSNIPVNAPRPWCPTTRRSASADSSTST